MRRLTVRLAAVAGIVASIGMAGPATANPICVGTQQTAGLCFVITDKPTYEDCVYLGPPPCIPVSVPGKDVDCGGWVGDQWIIECGNR